MIRAEIKFKNAVFMKALEKSRYSSIAELSRVSKIGYQSLINFASLKGYPKEIDVQVELATLLDCDMEQLFEQYKELINKNKGNSNKLTIDIPKEKMISMSSNKLLGLESDYDVNDINNKESLKIDVLSSLNTLKDREKDIIELHFGINKDRAYSMKEISEQYKLTRERVRQIFEKGMRRLRHFSRSDRLKEYVYEKDISWESARNYKNRHGRSLSMRNEKIKGEK
tara:strand:+ start:2599 stop:3276 length:678 start_codon:yes stop_codon:yes gene_type:complete